MRFLLNFYLTLLLLAALGLGLLLWATPYAALAGQLAAMRYGLRHPAGEGVLTPARYALLQQGLAATAVLAGLGLLANWRRSRKRGWLAQLGREARWVGAGLRSTWRAQAKGPRRALLGLLALVAAARLWYALGCWLTPDEIFSYDYSVLPGAAVTASYYPFPNNHLLANLLAALLHAAAPTAPPALALRLLPTLAGLLALLLLGLALLRVLRPAVLALGLGLFCLSPEPVFYAVAGRGYAWALLATLAGLLAAWRLLHPPARQPAGHRLAWAVFGASAVLGLYAVPTHLYTVLALGLGLLLGLARRPARRWRRVALAQLAATGLGVALVAGLLYAPVGAVSGWPALLANPYVARNAGAAYWANIGPFLNAMATELLGRAGWSAAAYAALVLAAPLVLWRAGQPVRHSASGAASLRPGPSYLPEPAQRLGWLLYALLTLWLPLALAQQVYPPARTLLGVLLAFWVLLALLAEAALARLGSGQPARGGALARGGASVRWVGAAGLVAALYGAYRLPRQWARFGRQPRLEAVLRPAYAWLRARHPRRVWVQPEEYASMWQHYALLGHQPPLPLVVAEDDPATPAGPTGELEVLAQPPRRAGQPVLYQAPGLYIVPVSPAYPRSEP